MTPEDKKDFQELFQLYLTNINGQMNSKFDIIDLKLDNIQTQVTKANGRTSKLEDSVADALRERDVNRQFQKDSNHKINNKIEEHHLQCPNSKRIETLEKESVSNEFFRKKMIQIVMITGVVSGVIFGFLKLIFG